MRLEYSINMRMTTSFDHVSSDMNKGGIALGRVGSSSLTKTTLWARR